MSYFDYARREVHFRTQGRFSSLHVRTLLDAVDILNAAAREDEFGVDPDEIDQVVQDLQALLSRMGIFLSDPPTE